MTSLRLGPFFPHHSTELVRHQTDRANGQRGPGEVVPRLVVQLADLSYGVAVGCACFALTCEACIGEDFIRIGGRRKQEVLGADLSRKGRLCR